MDHLALSLSRAWPMNFRAAAGSFNPVWEDKFVLRVTVLQTCQHRKPFEELGLFCFIALDILLSDFELCLTPSNHNLKSFLC